MVQVLQAEGVDFSSVNVLDYPDIREGGEFSCVYCILFDSLVLVETFLSQYQSLLLSLLAVKKFSEWPTIPQLYVNGEFIGGCDIITQMHESGELKEVLAEAKGEK